MTMEPSRRYPDEPAGPFPEPPATMTDREGRELTIERLPAEESTTDALTRMYRRFHPADRAQGIPPTGEAQIRTWLEPLVDRGVNVAVVSTDAGAVSDDTSAGSAVSNTDAETGAVGTTVETGTGGTDVETGTDGTDVETGTAVTDAETGTAVTDAETGTAGTDAETGTAGTDAETGTAGTDAETGTGETARSESGATGTTDAEYVGHAVLVPETDDSAVLDAPDAYEWELAIFVLQDYQGAGVGTALLSHLLGEATRVGIETVWLTVERWNGAAISLYEKVGFETVGTERFDVEMAIRLDAD